MFNHLVDLIEYVITMYFSRLKVISGMIFMGMIDMVSCIILVLMAGLPSPHRGGC